MKHLLPFIIMLCLAFFGTTGFTQTFSKVTGENIVTDSGNSGGSAWIDFDGDGYLDLFIANGNQTSQNNRLYRNDQTAKFAALATGEIVTEGGSSIGGTWGDYDNDGRPDLFVTNRALSNGSPTRNSLFRNDGNGNFAKITSGAIATDAADSNISSWLDIENDGDLDLFVVNFGQINFLYLNNGDGTFTRSTSEVISQSSFSISAIWGDYNNDGYPDLFIGNGGSGRNLLFSNDGDGSFTEVTTGAIVTDIASSTGCSWGDYNNDGNLDLFVANFLGANNFLYRNDGPPNYTFTKVTSGPVVSDGGNSVGSVWGDLDNDGYQDLFVGNSGQNNFLYKNNGDGTFSKMTNGAMTGDRGMTFGVSMADPDKDGDLDVYAANINNENNFFYLNDGSGNNWLTIDCTGFNSNVSAIGARVKVKARLNGANIRQVREISSQSGYNSQSGLSAHFGLADATRIDTIAIEWPSGIVDEYANVEPNFFYTAIEGDTIRVQEAPTSVMFPNSEPFHFSLNQNYPNPFNPSTLIQYQTAEQGHVRLRIFNSVGQEVLTLVDRVEAPGAKSISWHGLDSRGHLVSAGIYFYRLEVGGQAISRKMLFLQ